MLFTTEMTTFSDNLGSHGFLEIFTIGDTEIIFAFYFVFQLAEYLLLHETINKEIFATIHVFFIRKCFFWTSGTIFLGKPTNRNKIVM